ncbi:MAG TPA: hypothetical protein GXX75_09000 [Clostridiales bacterium]|nr:hypothetical protein [Clostridiales bacterium]
MLLRKLKADRNAKGRITVGLVGTHHGAGVTHTGLMLSFYLGEEAGLKTAFLECNQHHDLELIERAYEWQEKGQGTFSFRNITCHKAVIPPQIPHIYGEAYESLVLDFGTDYMANQEEFLRCGIKIVVGGASEWDTPKLVQFAKETAQLKGNEAWFYFISRSNDKRAAQIGHILQRRVWAVPTAIDPVLPSNSSNRFFRNILNL